MFEISKRLFFSFLLLGVLNSCGGISDWPKERFEKQRWAESKETVRYIYVRDIIERKLLINKTWPEVVSLLGEPSSKAEQEEFATYVVRADKGVLYILDIQFSSDSSKFVQTVSIRTD